MGTRGILGVHINGQTKAGYNQFDSYPDGMGFGVIDDLTEMLATGETELLYRGKAAALTSITNNMRNPSENEIKHLRDVGAFDGRVSEQTETDWYCLTRKFQGKLKGTLDSGYQFDAENFPADSLFCEFGYIVNFDTHEVECYRGFQRAEHTAGRFASAPVLPRSVENTYYPIALVGSIPFAIIRKDAALAKEAMVALFTVPEGEEEAA